jgi:aspartyl/asparaginyl beta-hydroxylase
MRNFYRLAQGLNMNAIQHALARQPDLWNENTFRTTFPNTPHVDVDDIWLRFSDPAKCDTTSTVIGDDSPIWFHGALKLPEVQPIILDLMRAVSAYELGRVLITRIKPGGVILPHTDSAGDYVLTRDRVRYHVVIQGLPGSMYRTGDETVNMKTGEIWFFNPLLEHEVYNHSADDRIHLLVDLVTWPTTI